MRSRRFLLGLAALAVPALVSVVAEALGHPWLAHAGLAVMLLLIGALALDTNKRVRTRYAGVRAAPAPPAPASSEEELMGTIRLLQAQYVGRLDRAQDSLDLATSTLLAAAGDHRRGRERDPGTTCDGRTAHATECDHAGAPQE